MVKWLLPIFGLLFLIPLDAEAQCLNNLISGCPSASAPQPGDYVLGYQNSQVPHTRKITNTQVVQGALNSRLTVPLMPMASTSLAAGVNLGIGTQPATCVPGDFWETSGGTFDCPAGSPHGPLGTGGATLPVFATPAGLPAATAANNGQQAFVQNCPNGSQAGAGATGCIYVVNDLGTWTALPNPTSQAITVGGQVLYPGSTTLNTGNGTRIQLSAAGASPVVGHAPAYDNNGNLIDSGVPPSGGTGGGGTVTASPQNAVPFFSSAGTSAVVSGLSIVNNAVLVTSNSGVPSEATTLPSGLTIPGATITSPTITGSISIAAATYTGKQTYAASVTGSASGNIPVGVAPTSPVNGDFWETASGLFLRVNGATQGPLIGTANTTAPLGGGGAGPTLTLTCTTCATTTNGGALTATAPLTISAGGLIALGAQPTPVTFFADSTTIIHNDTYPLVDPWPFTNTGTINSMTFRTGGTNSPSFTATMQIGTDGGSFTNVTGCANQSVSSTTDTTVTCTAANTIANGQTLQLVITGVTGSPFSSLVSLKVSKPAS